MLLIEEFRVLTDGTTENGKQVNTMIDEKGRIILL